MRFLLCVLATLLICGCDYFDDSEDTLHDDSEDTLNPIIDSTPVVIPTDADWELIATLERNPLRPATFYIFEGQNEAIEPAYRAGKHFIFEIGTEFRETRSIVVRHYIIQPTPPFQESDKQPGQLDKEEKDKGAFRVHRYAFLSEGWYVSKPNSPAVGLGVEFDLTSFEDLTGQLGQIEIGQTTIGLIDTLDNPIIGKGVRDPYIESWVRLRIYVSR